MEEIWKNVSVEPHTKTHQISSLGRVKSLSRQVKCGRDSFRVTKEKILKIATSKATGYQHIQLSNRGKTFLIHRLVGLAFIDNPENKEQVNHINGIKTDNRLVNLEWLHPYENQNHAYQYGLQKGKALSGKEAISTNKAIIMYNENEELKFDSSVLCAQHIGGNPKFIYRVLAGKRSHYKGYKFKRCA